MSLSRKDSLRSVTSFLHYVRGGVLLGVVGVAWATFEPLTFAAQVIPALKVTGAGLLGGAGGYWWWLRRQHPITPTHEDWACGVYITGLPGNGKTALAYQMTYHFCQRGWGWIWLSIKPSLTLLRYLPESARDSCLLFAPYSDNPRGLNFLKCYTNNATERELVADQTAELFERLHPHMSNNMRELLRMGTLALLMWADRENAEVTLWELYRTFQEEPFRDRILAGAPKPIRDAFDSDEVRKTTLQAVRSQLRRSVTSENLLVALSQRNGIDLWDVIANERWLVCDTPEGGDDGLGPGVASFVCQVVASRVQMLAGKRKPGSRPFACFADEFQEYANSSFAKGIATGREFGLAWVLIHQSRNNQGIGKDVQGAVHLTGTRYYFQQAPEDAKAAIEATEGRWSAEVFTHLVKRHYKALRRLRGHPVVSEGITDDLPEPNLDVAAAIIERNASGPTRAEILREIQNRKVVSRNDSGGDGESEAAGVS